jgi:hypothetical protein
MKSLFKFFISQSDRFLFYYLPLLLVFAFNPIQVSADTKTEELKRKSADIKLLQGQLIERISQVEQIRSSLVDQQRILIDEIYQITKKNQAATITQAEQFPRVRYNIELLRALMAYILNLDQKICYYQTGRDKLDYLQRLIDDDLKMISTLNDLKIDALTTQISLVINRYLPDAHVIQIDMNQIGPSSNQAVWDSIAKQKPKL